MDCMGSSERCACSKQIAEVTVLENWDFLDEHALSSNRIISFVKNISLTAMFLVDRGGEREGGRERGRRMGE